MTTSSSPRSEAELLARAGTLAGRTVGDVATDLGVEVPADARRAKGLVGRLVERALGATAGTRGVPDFDALGIELKTIPTRRDGRPRESTFVCHLPLHRIVDLDWEDSPVRAKLARVLFVPIEADAGIALARRRIGSPLLWSPSRAQSDLLAEDWEELAGRVGSGGVEAVTAHVGRALQVRPKGPNGAARTRAPRSDGGWLWTTPRGFYLRTWFTGEILRIALAAAAQ